MRKRRFYCCIVMTLCIVFFVGCNCTKINEKNTVNSYVSQITNIAVDYYPNCELTVSSVDSEGKEADYTHITDCSIKLDDDTNIIVTIYYNDKGWWPDRYYSVSMERSFNALSEIGFNEYNLNLFCELSNVASREKLNLITCESLINDNEKYNIKYDNDNFTPIEKYVQAYSGHNMYYTVIDHQAGNSPDGGYSEILESEFEL